MIKSAIYFYIWFVIIGLLLFLPVSQGITGAATYNRVDSVDISERGDVVIAFVSVSEDPGLEKRTEIVESVLLTLIKDYEKDSIVILKDNNDILGSSSYEIESKTMDVTI